MIVKFLCSVAKNASLQSSQIKLRQVASLCSENSASSTHTLWSAASTAPNICSEPSKYIWPSTRKITCKQSTRGTRYQPSEQISSLIQTLTSRQVQTLSEGLTGLARESRFLQPGTELNRRISLIKTLIASQTPSQKLKTS